MVHGFFDKLHRILSRPAENDDILRQTDPAVVQSSLAADQVIVTVPIAVSGGIEHVVPHVDLCTGGNFLDFVVSKNCNIVQRMPGRDPGFDTLRIITVTALFVDIQQKTIRRDRFLEISDLFLHMRLQSGRVRADANPVERKGRMVIRGFDHVALFDRAARQDFDHGRRMRVIEISLPAVIAACRVDDPGKILPLFIDGFPVIRGNFHRSGFSVQNIEERGGFQGKIIKPEFSAASRPGTGDQFHPGILQRVESQLILREILRGLDRF